MIKKNKYNRNIVQKTIQILFHKQNLYFKGHDISVDYWALGILIFEMLVGTPPFNSVNEEKIYSLVQRGIDQIDWPVNVMFYIFLNLLFCC